MFVVEGIRRSVDEQHQPPYAGGNYLSVETLPHGPNLAHHYVAETP